jgi:RNA recognition motif-containing protein
MAAEPAMQNYSRGAVSSSVQVQNLGEAVDEADLRSIFAFVLPPEVDVMYVKNAPLPSFRLSTLSLLCFRSMVVSVSTCDRTATVEYPTKVLATAAIDQLHGVVLEGRPLVVVRASVCAEIAFVRHSNAGMSLCLLGITELPSRRQQRGRFTFDPSEFLGLDSRVARREPAGLHGLVDREGHEELRAGRSVVHVVRQEPSQVGAARRPEAPLHRRFTVRFVNRVS